MATYASLTPEQRDVYQNWQNLQRAWCIAQAKANNLGEAINVAYTAQIQGILATLDDNTIAPNTSNLDGSQGLDSDAEAVTIQSHIQGILGSYNTSGHRELWAKAAGAGNLAGTPGSI